MKEQKRFSYPLSYVGNVFFLILFSICWPPLGVLLGVKNGRVVKKTSTFRIHYRGSWGWLLIWSIFFFPIAIILVFVKGVDVLEEENA